MPVVALPSLPTSARWCPLCGTQHAVAKGEPSPWPHITRPQIEALPALLEALQKMLDHVELAHWDKRDSVFGITCDHARAALALAEGGK